MYSDSISKKETQKVFSSPCFDFRDAIHLKFQCFTIYFECNKKYSYSEGISELSRTRFLNTMFLVLHCSVKDFAGAKALSWNCRRINILKPSKFTEWHYTTMINDVVISVIIDLVLGKILNLNFIIFWRDQEYYRKYKVHE